MSDTNFEDLDRNSEIHESIIRGNFEKFKALLQDIEQDY